MKYHNELNFRQKLSYHLLCGVGYFLSILPRFIRFGFTDICFAVLYYFVRYRRAVTRGNLARSFPEKSLSEIKKIEWQYYKHLSEMFIDSFGLIGISQKNIKQQFTYDDAELQDFNKHSSVICAMAHYGSWEHTTGYKLRTDSAVYPIYRPLLAKGVDEYFYRQRSKFGAEPCMMSATVRRIIKHRKENFIMPMLADQSPLRNEEEKWYTFLNQDTQFFVGIGQLAKRYGMGVYFLDITKVKRGRYHGRLIQIYDGKEDISYEVIIERYVRRLEEMIHRNPSIWAWSHNRWKRKKIISG